MQKSGHKFKSWVGLFGSLVLSISPVWAEENLPPLEFSNVVADVRRGAEFSLTIHPDLPKYHFHLIGNKKDNVVERIEIQQGEEPRIIQTLATPENSMSESPPKGSEYFKTEDLNFDGYQDVMLLNWWGATGNTGYFVWIFNPSEKKFFFSKEFSEVSNPKSLPETREVATTSVGGMAGRVHDFGRYRWIDGKPTLVWEEHQDWLEKERCFVKVIKERRGCEMVKLFEERVRDDFNN